MGRDSLGHDELRPATCRWTLRDDPQPSVGEFVRESSDEYVVDGRRRLEHAEKSAPDSAAHASGRERPIEDAHLTAGTESI